MCRIPSCTKIQPKWLFLVQGRFRSSSGPATPVNRLRSLWPQLLSEFRSALYANPGGFRNPEISQRGSQPPAPPVAFRCPSPAQSRTKQRCSRRTPSGKRSLATPPVPTRPAHACLPFEAMSGRNHTETWAGCIVSLTTPTRSPLNASRSVSSLSFAENASRVFLASYFLR